MARANHTCRCMSSSALIYNLSTVSGRCLRTWSKGDTYTVAEFSCLVLVFLPFPDLVVDLGDSAFAAPAFHQLVDGAFAIPLEFVQVLVEDLTRTQSRHQVVELAADLF